MKKNLGIILGILGFLCIVFGIIDFLGMFFHYNLTGVSYSPIIASIVGSVLIKQGSKLEKSPV
jgi:hypothetical protein